MTSKDYCNTCSHKSDDKKAVECGTCMASYYNGVIQGSPSNYKARPMTNAERIRAMSDEELKYIVRAVIDAENCPADGIDCKDCTFHRLCLSGGEYYGNEEEWLKQPAEVE